MDNQIDLIDPLATSQTHPDILRYEWLGFAVNVVPEDSTANQSMTDVIQSLRRAEADAYEWNCYLCNSYNPYGDGPVHEPDCPIHLISNARKRVENIQQRHVNSNRRQRDEFLDEMETLRPRVELILKAQSMSSFILYRHFDEDGGLLYVGKTNRSLPQRSNEHLKRSIWYKLTARTETERFDTQEELDTAEKHAIENEHPTFNKQHNTR